MLHQGSDDGCDHFTVMNFVLAMRQVTIYLFSPFGDCRSRDGDPFRLQPIPYGQVAVIGNRKFGIFYRGLLP